MIDPRLENQIERLNVFLQRWDRLYAIVKQAKRDKQVSAAENKELAEIRIYIARNYEPLAMEVGHQVDKDDHVLDILAEVRDAESINEMSDMQARKFDYTWHEAQVILNKLLGLLESRRRELALKTEFDLLKERLLNNPWVIYGIPAAIVIAIAIALGAHTWLYNAIKDILSG